MADSKIRDDNYFQVSGWMINRLNLKGAALQVFSIIYGFSQDGESCFAGSLQYLCDFTNASKPTIIKALKELTEKNYVIKYEHEMNGVKFNQYKVNLPVVKNLNWGSKETLLGGSQVSLPGGSKETLPNNKYIYNKSLIEKEIVKEIIDLYHSICVSYPSIRAVSESREKAIKARLTTYGVDDFRLLFEKAEASSFLKGENDKGWSATFDWLIKDSNMAKVLEGNYDSKSKRCARNLDDDEYTAIQRMMAEPDEPYAEI